ncbi:MAG: DUF4256 domain-containing protein [Paenibacillaceae bacterium]|nr:DUF4256 domain-containing protein [Paenibacillaceae bacterium]
MRAQMLQDEQRTQLLCTLNARFEQHMSRHINIAWETVRIALEAQPEALWALHEMERTGGAPDVVCAHDAKDEIGFFDCSPESPIGRRNVCYDEAARQSRTHNAPIASAMGMAASMGIDLLTKEQYALLHSFVPIDHKTSSWLHTPEDIRARGGALFGDVRYGHAFVYHNGAQSYFAARGFRGARIVKLS